MQVRSQIIYYIGLRNSLLILPTDIQTHNILLGIDPKDEGVCEDYEERERVEPVAQKQANGRIIYASRMLPLTLGMPVLGNLGKARFADSEACHGIIQDGYRAPEVILEMN